MTPTECTRLVREWGNLAAYWRSDVPPCIYFLFYRGEVVYIGQSQNLHSRLWQHTMPKDPDRKIFDEVRYFACKRDRVLDVEARFVLLIRPRLNDCDNRHYSGRLRRSAERLTGVSQ